MHIPDGFVCAPVNLGAAAVAAGAVGYGLYRLGGEVRREPGRMPLVAMTAAFIFAAQMLNFPVGGGTSGHFLGAVTAAALLGPWAACVILALVLVIQTFGFADGGLTALGTNIFNMGVIGGLLGWGLLHLFRALLPRGRWSLLFAAGAASWCSVVLASSACALELAVSGTSPLTLALPAMAGVHAVIGVGEGLICAAALSAVAAARPDLLPECGAELGAKATPAAGGGSGRAVRRFVLAGVGLSLLLGALVSQYASASPDGLEKIAQEQGFLAAAAEPAVWTRAPLPEYSVPGVESEGWSTGLAGFAGTAGIFLAGYALIRLTARRSAAGAAEGA